MLKILMIVKCALSKRFLTKLVNFGIVKIWKHLYLEVYMNIRLSTFFSLFFLVFCAPIICQELDYSRARINNFVPGIGRARPWLSIIVGFDKSVTSTYMDTFCNYVSAKLSPNIIGTIKRNAIEARASTGEILFKLKDQSITKQEFQRLIDEANSFLDPIEIKKRSDVQDKLKKEELEREIKARTEALKKQLEEDRLREEAANLRREKQRLLKEEERLRKESERKATEERQAIARAKSEEDRRMRAEQEQLRLHKLRDERLAEFAKYTAYERKEYQRLTLECSRIFEQVMAMGGSSSGSSASCGAIVQYLKNIGTPIAIRVLKDQVAAGRVPASYLS